MKKNSKRIYNKIILKPLSSFEGVGVVTKNKKIISYLPTGFSCYNYSGDVVEVKYRIL